MSQPLLSILICTVPPRRDFMSKMMEYLEPQLMKYPTEVECLIDLDAGEALGGLPIGAKRERLKQRSVGQFLAYIDDDDYVVPQYCDALLGAIKACPNADVVELHGFQTINGGNPRPFHHSIRYPDWSERQGVWMRCPNHLNPVRREIALKVPFRAISFGEDHKYSVGLRPYLQVEAPTSQAVYRYDFVPLKQSVFLRKLPTPNEPSTG